MEPTCSKLFSLYYWNFNKFSRKPEGQSYETITILGHSLGGVLLGKVLESVNTKVPIVAHIIASPLLK